MYVLTAYIKIGNVAFRRVHDVQIESSAERVEDTATVRIPTTARLEREGEYITEVETARQFRVGDAVEIHLGYGAPRLEFRGYVSKIQPTTPLVIECMDATWVLRRKNLHRVFGKTTLRDLLAYIVADTPIKIVGTVPTVNFKKFVFRNVTAATALQKIKDEYGLKVYLKNGAELYVHLRDKADVQTVKYEFGTNVIEHDLEWVDESDTRIRIKAVHVKKDNTQVTHEYGDKDGELRTFYFYNVESETELRRLAEQASLKYKFTGYKGGITTFLLPNVQVGNVARLNDPQFAERAGDYMIDKVTTTFGQNGARRKVELGIKVK